MGKNKGALRRFFGKHFHLICSLCVILVEYFVLFIHPNYWPKLYHLLTKNPDILSNLTSLAATIMGFSMTTASILLMILIASSSENRVIKTLQKHPGTRQVFTAYTLLALYSALILVSRVVGYFKYKELMSRVTILMSGLMIWYLILAISLLWLIVSALLSEFLNSK